jgi:protein-L-isoaspartate(D-aspartate) O-methyltransferase
VADPPVRDVVAGQRMAMVDELLRRSALLTFGVEQAFRSVPRDVFLPRVPLEDVYTADRAVTTRLDNRGVPISSSSAPTIMAVMLERLACERGDHVLEVGTGTGYNAALLAHLVGTEGSVLSMELDADIAEHASAVLREFGFAVDVRVGDGWLGAADAAPFDRVIVTAGVWDVSPAWAGQLRDGGRLVVPLWIGPGFELAVSFARDRDRLVSTSVDWCGFMRLRGPHAGPESWVRVGDWTTTVVSADADAIARLEELLSTSGTRQRLPVPPAWWFARLAVGDPGAIHLVHIDDPARRMWGVFDPTEPSLALVHDDELVTWNDGSAADRLRRFLDAEPLNLAHVAIEAAPLGAPTSPDAVVLSRPDHQIVISGLR